MPTGDPGAAAAKMMFYETMRIERRRRVRRPEKATDADAE
jgi:hypothetical protein